MATFIKIAEANAAAGGSASLDFSVIPGTYTDLKIVLSSRFSDTTVDAKISFNGSTTSFTRRHLQGNGNTASSGSGSDGWIGSTDGTNQTASTFGNAEIYIPNYASSNYKSYSVDHVSETNSGTAYATLIAGLWSNAAAITSISISALSGSANFVQYSTATLYGISKS